MQLEEDRRVIPAADELKKKSKKKKKKEKIDATEEPKIEEERRRKNNNSKKTVEEIVEDGAEKTSVDSEKEAEIESTSNEKKKKEKKKKEKKRDKESTSSSSLQEHLDKGLAEVEEAAGAHMKDKKKKKKEKGTKFESLFKSGTEEGKGSGNGDKKRKGTISNEGETEKKKRTKYDNKDGKDKKVTKDKKKKNADGSKTDQPKEKLKSKRVSFSGDVEVFPPSDDSDCEVEYDEGNLVRGKRFSEEEDQLIRDAVENYIQTNQLGEDGLKMVLKCSKYPQVKDCWKEIGLALPWRPYLAVYSRAHTIFERSEKRGFSKEEKEIIKKFHAEHGPQWKELSEVLGKQRIHIKDAWRRVRLPNEKKGHWSQDEYQSLFDLVNLDLRIKAFEKKKSDNVMKREDISWEAISDKITTRTMSSCCHKWYDQLRSPLVAQGVWADSDDYRLLDSLQKQDGCNVEEVDWDSLVEGRCGEVCRKRWGEMVRHIGGHRERTFIEQVDVLIKRYCGDMLEYRFRREEEEEEEEEG